MNNYKRSKKKEKYYNRYEKLKDKQYWKDLRIWIRTVEIFIKRFESLFLFKINNLVNT
jgi:hypothetical protein